MFSWYFYTTSLAGKVMRSVVSIRPAVFPLSSKPTDLWSWFFCICIDHKNSSSRIKSQGHRSRLRRVRVTISKTDQSVAFVLSWSVWRGSSINGDFPHFRYFHQLLSYPSTLSWIYIGWKWRNLVPYLCQVVFGAILWVKLWETFSTVISIK